MSLDEYMLRTPTHEVVDQTTRDMTPAFSEDEAIDLATAISALGHTARVYELATAA